MAPLTVIFDPVTSLIVRQRYRGAASPSPGATGAPATVDTEEEFSDFRDVGGLGFRSARWFAWTVRSPSGGRSAASSTTCRSTLHSSPVLSERESLCA